MIAEERVRQTLMIDSSNTTAAEDINYNLLYRDSFRIQGEKYKHLLLWRELIEDKGADTFKEWTLERMRYLLFHLNEGMIDIIEEQVEKDQLKKDFVMATLNFDDERECNYCHTTRTEIFCN
jgi:hypothetical protein